MQRYNFQFTGQRFFRIENGRLAGQLRDVAYQATTTDFWGSMEAVGGPQTYVLGGAFNCGKAQPGQVAPVSHGCPSALFAASTSSTPRRRPADEPPHASRRRSSSGRWQLSTGRRASSSPTRAHGQPALGGQQPDHQRRRCARGRSPSSRPSTAARARPPASSPAPGRRTSPSLVRRPSRPPATPGRPRTRSRWSRGAGRRRDWAAEPAETSIEVFARLRPGAGRGLRRGPRRRARLYGFAEHELTSTYLGTLHRAAAAARPADRHAGAERQDHRLRPLGVGGRRHPGLQGRRRAPTRRRAGAAAGLGGAPDRAARRAVRDAAAADRGRRPDDLPALDGGGPGRGRGPHGLLQAGRRHPGRRAAGRAAADPAQRPERAGPGVRAVRGRRLLRRRPSVFDNGLPTPAVDWITDGDADQPDPAARPGR